jgi:hypothetical protein
VSDASANFLNAHEWAYGVTEVAHIVSLGIAIGLIAVLDLRLLDQGIVQATPVRLLRATTIGTLIGFVMAITTTPSTARWRAAVDRPWSVVPSPSCRSRCGFPSCSAGFSARLPNVAPTIVCAVSVADAMPGPPTGARSSPVASAPESIDDTHALKSHHEPGARCS